MTLTYSGCDENALETLMNELGVTLTARGCTQRDIEQAALAAVADLVYVGNDVSMMERITANAAYTFRLDDDGTTLAVFNAPYASFNPPVYLLLTTQSPDRMAFSHTTLAPVVVSVDGQTSTSYMQKHIATSKRATQSDGSFLLPENKIVVLGEYLCTASPDNANQSHGMAVATYSAGAITKYVAACMANPSGNAGNSVFVSSGVTGLFSNETEIIGGFQGKRIGLYVNTGTGQTYYRYAGSSVASGSNGSVTISSGVINTAQRVSVGLFCENREAGHQIGGRLYVRKADLALTYPVGAVDLYGELI